MLILGSITVSRPAISLGAGTYPKLSLRVVRLRGEYGVFMWYGSQALADYTLETPVNFYAMPWPLFVALFSLLAILIKKAIGTRHRPFPPGPKPKPLIGNMLDIPLVDAAGEYVKWGKKYGSDILYANALGTHILVLNKQEDADELFEKRSHKYSDRPYMPVIELGGWGLNTALLNYGEEWRFHRKVCQQNFRPKASVNYNPIQICKVHMMLRGLLRTPEDFDHHNKLLSIGIAMSIMYGYDVESVNDPCIVVVEKAMSIMEKLIMPGGSLVNVIPLLRYIPSYIPGASSHKLAAEARRLTDLAMRMTMEFTKKRLNEGTAIPSLVSNFLEKKNTVGATAEEQRSIENIAFTIYGAGSDTTISTTRTFFYCMLVNPGVQRRAQEEIDRIIGNNRLPTFEDRASMPYLEAVYREIMRWRPPGPLAIPHCVTEDDYYKGYFIPKGTVVLPNIWAMTRDETVYPDASTFEPGRFLNADGSINKDTRILAYGFGRRVCAGRHLASSTMWLIIASVLASFNITRAKDESGNEIEIDHEFTNLGVLTHKAPFKCSFTPRSPLSRKLVEETAI